MAVFMAGATWERGGRKMGGGKLGCGTECEVCGRGEALAAVSTLLMANLHLWQV